MATWLPVKVDDYWHLFYSDWANNWAKCSVSTRSLLHINRRWSTPIFHFIRIGKFFFFLVDLLSLNSSLFFFFVLNKLFRAINQVKLTMKMRPDNKMHSCLRLRCIYIYAHQSAVKNASRQANAKCGKKGEWGVNCSLRSTQYAVRTGHGTPVSRSKRTCFASMPPPHSHSLRSTLFTFTHSVFM